MGSLLSSGFFQLIAVERYFLIVQTFAIQQFQKRYKHLMVVCNLILASVTIIPYLQGVDIEAESGRCVNFIGSTKRIASLYAGFTLLVYSILPIGVTSLLSINLARHFAKEKDSLLMVKRDDINKRILVNMLVILSPPW